MTKLSSLHCSHNHYLKAPLWKWTDDRQIRWRKVSKRDKQKQLPTGSDNTQATFGLKGPMQRAPTPLREIIGSDKVKVAYLGMKQQQYDEVHRME